MEREKERWNGKEMQGPTPPRPPPRPSMHAIMLKHRRPTQNPAKNANHSSIIP